MYNEALVVDELILVRWHRDIRCKFATISSNTESYTVTVDPSTSSNIAMPDSMFY